jgi:hypothetical protein
MCISTVLESIDTSFRTFHPLDRKGEISINYFMEMKFDQFSPPRRVHPHYIITLLFSSLPIGAFQWPITSSITLMSLT